MSVIISLFNNKGGVGKTTSVFNLAYAFEILNQKVLCIDSDAQSNLTNSFFKRNNDIPFENKSFYDVMTGKNNIENCIIKYKDNINVLPSNSNTSFLDKELSNYKANENILKKHLKKIKNDFNIILIDCSPSLSLINDNVLTTSNYYLIPCQLEFYSLEGIRIVYDYINDIKENLNEELELLGCFGTFLDLRKKSNKKILGILKDHFKEKMFKTVINDNVKYSETPSVQMTFREYMGNESLDYYLKLAKEIIERIK